MNNFEGTIYSTLEWIMKAAYVNLLWVLFTVVGGIVLGFYPATIAMFAVVRDWFGGKTDQPVFRSFWSYYKRDFLKSNQLGIFLNVLFLLFAIDIFYIYSGNQMSWVYIPLFAYMLILLFFSFFIFPAFTHFELKVIPLIKNTFSIMLLSPIHSFLIIISLISIFFIMRLFPALFFIFGGITYATITTWLSLHTFNKIQSKLENSH